MGIIKRNITANFFGAIWMALMSIIFVPLYIKFLGIESWGIIGVFTTLQTVFSIFDIGLSAALTRELSRLSILPGKEQEMRNLVRSMEIIYWGIAVFIGLLVISISHYVAYNWVNPGHLSQSSIHISLIIMGGAMAVQWPVSLYSGGLIGLQKQVSLNWINISMSTLRGFGAVAVIWLVSPTILAFFLWQIIVSALHLISTRIMLWRYLPRTTEKAIFQNRLLFSISRFAAGMSGFSILGMIFTQVDKVILSKTLSLEQFGYYSLATSVALGLTRLFSPVFFSIYPRFTQYVASNDITGLKNFYHKCAQFMSLIIIPVALIIVIFSYEVLKLWTQNIYTAQQTYILVSILVTGTAINGIMNPPFALQLAYGWTRLIFFANLISVVIIIPAIYFSSQTYGANGAVICLSMQNLLSFLIIIPLVHKRFLTNEKWKWYFKDTGIPFVAAFSAAILGRLILNENASTVFILIFLLLISAITFIITLLALPEMRAIVLKRIQNRKFIKS